MSTTTPEDGLALETALPSRFIAYFVLAYRTAFGTTPATAAWRSAIVLVLRFAAVTITLLAIAIPAMFGAWGNGAP